MEVMMTVEAFEALYDKAVIKAVEEITKDASKNSADPMVSMVVGMTSTMAAATIKKHLFNKEEKQLWQ